MMRLNKFISESGKASRRGADKLIEEFNSEVTIEKEVMDFQTGDIMLVPTTYQYCDVTISTSISMKNLVVVDAYTTNNGGKNDGAIIDRAQFPYTIMKSYCAATMQTVAMVVGHQLIFLAIQRETAIADAIAIAANQRTKIAALCTILDIVGYIIVTQADVNHVVILVGHHNADDASTKIGETHLHAIGIAQGI